MTKEINELSKKLLGRYIKYAAADKVNKAFGFSSANSTWDEKDKEAKKYRNRDTGIDRAVDKLTMARQTKKKRYKKISEEAPTNSVASNGVPSLTDPNQPVGLVRRSKFAGAECFEVDADRWHKAQTGKEKFKHYKTYVGNDEIGKAIRDYGNSNPAAPIVLKHDRTGAMVFLKYGRA